MWAVNAIDYRASEDAFSLCLMSFGIHPLASLIIVVPIMFALGYALQRGLLNFTLGEDILPPLLVLVHVILPASLPAILSGLRVGLGLALVVTITAEMIAGAGGLGYFLVQTQYAMRPAEMYAAVLCLAATGYLLNRGFLVIEARLIVWHGSGHRRSR